MLGPNDNMTILCPRVLHTIGARDRRVYRLVLNGPWNDRFYAFEGETGPSHSVWRSILFFSVLLRQLRKRARRKGWRGTRTFAYCGNMVEVILAVNRAERDQQNTHSEAHEISRQEGRLQDVWLSHLRIQLSTNLCFISTSVTWRAGVGFDQLQPLGLVAVWQRTIRICCGASMGGLDPDMLQYDEATRKKIEQ